MTSSKNLIKASAGNVAGGSFYDYEIENSARFNEPDSPKLVRSHSSAGNTQKGTFSLWVKRSAIAEQQLLLMVTSLAGNDVDTFACQFNASDEIQIENQGGTLRTNAVYRDVSAWLHIVVQADTTQSTASNRTKLWVNGEQITSFAFADYPALNASGYNLSSHKTGFSEIFAGARFFEGYVSQLIFCDGQTYTASDFGENKNGVWIPKDPSGLTFGTNGFYLDFSNSAALGTDVSGNSNNLTSSGLTSSDQMIDTPTNNFPTYTPSETHVYQTISDGNLQSNAVAVAYSAPNYANYNPLYASMRLPSTGKWYWEGYCVLSGAVSGYLFGIADSTEFKKSVLPSYTPPTFRTYWSTGNSGYYGYRSSNSSFSNNNSNYPVAHMSIAIDMDTGKMWVGANGSWIGGGNPATGTSPGLSDLLTGDGEGVEWCPYFGSYVWSGLATGATSVMNFGQGGANALGNSDENGLGNFRYAPPSGYLALCTANLPEPTIGPNSAIKPEDCFATVLYTGNGTAIGSGGKAVTGVGFQPDLVVIKNLDAADAWMVFDSVRGATKYTQWDNTNAEATDTESLTSFDADGFTLGSNVAVNTNTENYVAYCFKITAGFFDIQSYTGTGVAKTETHDLGVVPNFMVVKNLSVASGHVAYCSALPVADPETDYIYLDVTSAVADLNTIWNDTAPTSTVFTVGTNGVTNQNTGNFIAYLFADVEGFCKHYYYAGNGSADGAFAYLNHEPLFMFLKRTDSGGGWFTYDTERSPYNVVVDYIDFQTPAAVLTLTSHDINSNGIKLRTTNASFNASGGDFIGLSIGTSSKYSNAR